MSLQFDKHLRPGQMTKKRAPEDWMKEVANPFSVTTAIFHKHLTNIAGPREQFQ